MNYKKIIAPRVKIYGQIIKLFNDHIPTLANIKNIYESVSAANKYISNTRKLIVGLLKIASGAFNLDKHFGIYAIVARIEKNIEKVMSLTKIEEGKVMSDMSDTFVLDVIKKHDKIKISWNMLMKKLQQEDIIHIFGHYIKDKPLADVEPLYFKYPTALNLYCHYIQLNLLRDSDSAVITKDAQDLPQDPPQNHDSAGEFLMAVERIKDNIFNQKIPSNNTLQTFNLVPVYQNISLSNVINKALNIQQQDASIEQLSGLLKEKKKGLFILWEIIKLPIKYNLRGMTDKKMVFELKITPNSGIDYKIMKKYKTIELGKESKTKLKQEKLGDTKSDSWLIIRTLDGLKFDIMAHNRRELYHSSYFIKKLQRPSARIHMYQEKRNRELLKYVGEPKEIVLHEKYDEAHSISGMLKIKFEAYAEERLQENIPTNLLEYHTLFKNKDITKIVSQVLMDSFLKYDHDLETMNTFVYLIDKLAQKTRREINEGFAKSPLTERNFTIYTRNALIVIIRKELHNIINTSISKNFGTNTDFYEMLFVKRALMSI